MKTLKEIRALATNVRQQLVTQELQPKDDSQQQRQRCARLRELAEQLVAVAAQAGEYSVRIPVGTGDEYSYLELLYGSLGYRTAPADGDHSTLIIIIKWN